MPAFLLACLAYLTVALPSSALGLLWPSMRLNFHEPVGALGILLAVGVIASVVSSTATGRILARVGAGQLLAAGTIMSASALALEALAPSLWVVAIGFALFGFGFGATDSCLNAYAAQHFGARRINWMHACYGLGATTGPLLVTLLLSNKITWRWTYGSMAGALLLLGVLLTWSSRRFEMAPQGLPAPPPGREDGGSSFVTAAKSQSLATVVNALSFVALETGIESGAGIWGFIFLTAGRGLSPASAGLAVSGYWAMMFLGRAVFGPLAETAGNARVLSGAVLGVVVGAGLMWVPGPRLLPVVAMMILGLAAAPIFPLFTLETSARLGGELTGTTRTVSLQVAASALGSAAVPGGIGLFLGAFNPRLLAPCLLALALAMWVSYRGVPHQAGDPNKVSKHPG